MTHYLSSSVRRLGTVVAVAGVLSLYTGSIAAQRTMGIPPKADAWTTMHVLNRIGFGARPGDVERVQAQGVAAYIEEQLHPERIPDTAMAARLADFTTLNLDSRDLAEKYFQPAQQLKKQTKVAAPPANASDPSMMAMAGNTPPGQPQLSAEERMVRQAQQSVMSDLTQAKMLRAVESDRQLQEVLTDFWFNHFNVFVGKGQVREYLTEYEREAIRPHVLGKFRDLLGATAHSPAMLFYLDNFQSAAPDQPAMLNPEMARRLNDPRLPPFQRQQLAQRLQQAKNQPKGLNENYGRELMELHTLGVDGGYTQQDVVAVARALTGWTIDRQQGTFVFRPQMHDTKPKTILGVEFNGKGGQDEGERVLDLLAKHPSTAHHIAFELAQRFVADDPPASLVDRAAKVFLDTKGDLREVTRTIITSPEFFDSDAYRAKVKTPFEFIVSAVRASGATITNAQPLVGQMNQLGMPLYGCQPPTGYSMTADAWVNTGSLLNRMNFALQLVGGGGPAPQGRGAGAGANPNRPNQPPPGGRIGQPPPGGRIGQPPPAGAGQPPQRPLAGQGPGARAVAQMARQPMQVDLHALAPDTSEASRDHVIAVLLAGRASDGTMKTLARAENPQQLIALTLGSPEFQRR